MNTRKSIVVALIFSVLVLPCPAWAQQAASSGIGTVTALQGQATVGRVALPQPTSLKFRDDVFFRDQITTKAQATVRLLLGGKGVLTIREQSQVTLDESVAPTGERRSVLTVLGGKIAAAIARSLMRPGEEIEVRTPNAVAAVRGTVLIAEYIPAATSAEGPKPILLASSDPNFRVAQAGTPATGQSNFLVLTGSVTVTALGAPPVTVGAMQTVSISVGPTGGAQVGPVQTATQAQVALATQGFQMGKSISGDTDGGKAAQAQAQVAATIAGAIAQATSGTTTTAPSPPPPATQPDVSPVVVPVTPTPPPASVQNNDLPSGPLLQVNSLTMTVPTGTPVMNLSPGEVNTVVPVIATGTGIDTTVVALTSPTVITGSQITHTGPLLGLNSAALVSLDSATPIIQVGGTTFTGTATGGTGALAAVDNGSFLQTAGNLLVLSGGGSLNVTGTALSISGQSAVVAGGVLFRITEKSTVKTSGGPLVRITDGSLLASGFGSSDGTGNQITIGGGLLDATNSLIEFTGQANNDDLGDGTVMAQPAGVPQIRLTSSSLFMGGMNSSVVDFGSGTTKFDGLLLIATDSTIATAGDLLGINSGTISTTEASVPLIQLTRTTVNNALGNVGLGTGGKDLLYVGGSASLTLAGPLLSATGGQLTTGGSLIHLDGAAALTATTSQPLLQFTGVNTDTGTGLGVDEVLRVGDGLPILNATFVPGGSINLKGTGSLLSMDTALVNAVNSTMLQISGGTVRINGNPAFADPFGRAGGVIDIYRTSVVMNQVVNLTNTDILIANGPLLNLVNSNMTVNGDFAKLSNARFTVSNGPLVNLNGSTLNVRGNLVNFVGTGSVFSINNAITPTGTTVGGIPFSADATSSVNSTSTVINNAAGNTVILNGSVFKAVNGSQVNIGLAN
jgi:hypothetical protein